MFERNALIGCRGMGYVMSLLIGCQLQAKWRHPCLWWREGIWAIFNELNWNLWDICLDFNRTHSRTKCPWKLARLTVWVRKCWSYPWFIGLISNFVSFQNTSHPWPVCQTRLPIHSDGAKQPPPNSWERKDHEPQPLDSDQHSVVSLLQSKPVWTENLPWSHWWDLLQGMWQQVKTGTVLFHPDILSFFCFRT